MDINQLIEELKAQGLEEEQILESLGKMVEEGKITPEDLEKAKEILAGTPSEEEEKTKAENLFGLKF